MNATGTMESATVTATATTEKRCPECNQVLKPVGETTLNEAQVPLYQCPSCIEEGELFGMKYDAPVTFAVMPDGEMVRPGKWNATG